MGQASVSIIYLFICLSSESSCSVLKQQVLSDTMRFSSIPTIPRCPCDIIGKTAGATGQYLEFGSVICRKLAMYTIVLYKLTKRFHVKRKVKGAND